MRPTCARSGSRTSARRRCSGSAPPGGRSTARSSGRTGGRPRGAASCRPTSIRARTGLVPDPYFSATKLEWLLARTEARPSELAFGTVDSWLDLEAHRRPRARHRPDERVADDVARSRLARLGRRAARALRRRPCAAASPRPLVRGGRRGEAARRDAADRGHRRRSAGGALRARLPRARRGEGDLRDGELRPRQRGSPRASRRRRACWRPRRRPAATRSRARSSRAVPRSSGCATASGS